MLRRLINWIALLLSFLVLVQGSAVSVGPSVRACGPGAVCCAQPVIVGFGRCGNPSHYCTYSCGRCYRSCNWIRGRWTCVTCCEYEHPGYCGGGGGGGGGGSSGGGGSGGGGGGSTPPPPKPPSGKIVASPEQLEAAEADLAEDFEHNAVAKKKKKKNDYGLPRRGSTDRVWLPPRQDRDRIHRFNNPNKFTFPNASSRLPRRYRNKIGYITYVQFMMDWGRDRSPDASNSINANPDVGTKTPLSTLSPYCPYHLENTAGGIFRFPPREQPMHAVRRALIAAIQVIKEQNAGVSPQVADHVGIVTFDGRDCFHAPQVVMPLTANYDAAMEACTTLQAVSDIGRTTATEDGLMAARSLLKPVSEGGMGRTFTSKVIVLLTDGVPNVWHSDPNDIADFIDENPSPDWYDLAYPWYNSVLMQASMFHSNKTHLFPVGMGLGADYDFMDRVARMAHTDTAGQSPRGSGNPATYEQQLVEIFRNIIQSPGTRLVQ